MNVLRRLSSLKLTLAGMMALIVGIFVIYKDIGTASAWVAAPLLVLSINLLSALVCNPCFRRQSGLLIFHVCLLAVMLFASYGWLSGLKGRVELMQGQAFDANAVTVLRQGELHPWTQLASVKFRQASFRVEYSPNLVRGQTESRLMIEDEYRAQKIVPVGDNVPLKLAGYRFYTTANKGYAAVLTWVGDGGDRQRGAVHFPSYPFNDWKQQNQWTTPDGQKLKLALNLPEKPRLTKAWVLDSRQASGTLSITTGDNSSLILKPGQSAGLKGGRLRFERVRMWMGYEIFYDPMLSWLFAAAVVGVLGLAWHFYKKLHSRSRLVTEYSSDMKEVKHGRPSIST